ISSGGRGIKMLFNFGCERLGIIVTVDFSRYCFFTKLDKFISDKKLPLTLSFNFMINISEEATNEPSLSS
ncbi:hypothetical protein, partial [Francisella tularensis]|uniref:hypothetical protein n=1 Tax=Francisella tularensis TaxID=263 RepID=UPI002381A82D